MTASELDAALQRVFGFSGFRPYQREIVADLVGGRDAFVLLPTGGGKSLCYQLPALLRPGTAIVVSPLIALMKDQVDALVQNGVAAACYNSSLEAAEARRTLARLHAGDLDLLYVAPERLLADGFLERLDGPQVALFAIDEAHCVSQWGHDFRPEYAQLGVLAARFPGVPRIALTATADPQTREDIVRVLGLDHAARHVGEFDRANIRYTVAPKSDAFRQLERFLAARPGESGIVYALSRKRVEEVADKLANRGLAAAAYHAGLPKATRSEVQERFLRDELQVVVATVAFGMGIDKPNVRFVVHYDLPRHLEGYYQETGRAGRDGLPADCILYYSGGDRAKVERFIDE
ncbi:MAG TPA: RecQ family ATP-dependent DNA helicase, partial [Gammaproteobacteria bacterium]